jgi:hypothetical protein
LHLKYDSKVARGTTVSHRLERIVCTSRSAWSVAFSPFAAHFCTFKAWITELTRSNEVSSYLGHLHCWRCNRVRFGAASALAIKSSISRAWAFFSIIATSVHCALYTIAIILIRDRDNKRQSYRNDKVSHSVESRRCNNQVRSAFTRW